MAFSTPRALLLSTVAIVLACNPDKGDSGSTGDITGSSSTDQPTGGSSGDSSGGTTEGTGLACGEDAEFTASWDAWQAAVQANGATYFYTVVRGGTGIDEPDCFYRTLIAVVDGAVVERRFEVSQEVDGAVCDAPFVETGDQLGTHTQNWAAVPATVDDLYVGCCDMVLHKQPAEEFTPTFETDDAGLMRTCFTVSDTCADSCDTGPLGTSLTFETLAFGAPPPAP